MTDNLRFKGGSMKTTKIDVKRAIDRHNKTAEIAIQFFLKGGGEVDPFTCWVRAERMAKFISTQADQLKENLKREAEELASEL